ncbi:DNA-deoxyinosine glycosylase [Mycobacterium sp. NPDC050551]|uniref:DNA-deoxyinosine glycosylase n=1 Tax=Mycobacterium sp. NPDC050551 TaxID=3155407 RepID=UPI00342A5B3A
MTTPVSHGFPPLVGARPRLLVLGNMPSVLSLGARQYYANPRNAFWRIAGDLFGFDADAGYHDRVAALLGHGVAVWDVLRSCRRAGSLDSAVERTSMVANDFPAFFAGQPSIARVVFNGAAAEQNFQRLVSAPPDLSYVRAPSTSPAQTMRYADKLAAWRRAVG